MLEHIQVPSGLSQEQISFLKRQRIEDYEFLKGHEELMQSFKYQTWNMRGKTDELILSIASNQVLAPSGQVRPPVNLAISWGENHPHKKIDVDGEVLPNVSWKHLFAQVRRNGEGISGIDVVFNRKFGENEILDWEEFSPNFSQIMADINKRMGGNIKLDQGIDPRDIFFREHIPFMKRIRR